MGRMMEVGMTEQERSEAWDKLACLLTKHGLQDKFEDWGVMHGMVHALHNVKEALINLGEKDIAKFMKGVIEEVQRAQVPSCSGGCKCEVHEELKGAVGGDEVVTPAEGEEIQEVPPSEVINLGDGSEYRPF